MMDDTMAAQQIRDTVSMDQILSFYGYTTQHGFMSCPFHGEHDPSLKVYQNRSGHSGWHCFGCGRGGSVIDFVKEHENCNFITAVKAIDTAFSLNLFSKDANPFKKDNTRERRIADEFVAAMTDLCDDLIDDLNQQILQECRQADEIDAKRKKDPMSLSPAEWETLAGLQEENEYRHWLISRAEDLKKEVAAWRRTKRAKAP